MQEEDQQSWKIQVHAKASNFNLKLKASNLKIHRLTLLLKLRKFFLRLDAQSSPPIPSQQQRRTLISKFLRIFMKSKSIPPKISSSRRNSDSKFHLDRLKQYARDAQEPFCFGGSFMAIVALISQKAAMIFGLVLLLHIALLLKKWKTGETSKLLAILVVVAVASSLVPDLSSYLQYDQGSAFEFVWKLWKTVASLMWETLGK
ncbi:hypothetical protein UlMin_000783 [Ulmus minor]